MSPTPSPLTILSVFSRVFSRRRRAPFRRARLRRCHARVSARDSPLVLVTIEVPREPMGGSASPHGRLGVCVELSSSAENLKTSRVFGIRLRCFRNCRTFAFAPQMQFENAGEKTTGTKRWFRSGNDAHHRSARTTVAGTSRPDRNGFPSLRSEGHDVPRRFRVVRIGDRVLAPAR